MKNSVVKYYNVHDILTFQIVCDAEKNYLPDFNFPFSYFEVEYVEKPSIVLNISPFEPNNNGCDIVFKKCHVKRNYIYCRERDGLAAWHVEFIGIEEETTVINFAWERRTPKAFVAPHNFPQIYYLEPLIEYKLTKMGYCLLHAAAMVKGNEAILFAGRSGSSKTPLIAHSISQLGYSYLSDDKVIIRDGLVYSFPRYVNLFNYMMRGNYSKELGGFLEKLKAVVFIRKPLKIKNGRGLFTFEFNITDIARIKSINVICRSDAENCVKNAIQHENKQRLIASLVYNNYAEMWVSNLFIDYLKAYAYIFPEVLQPYTFGNLYQSIYGAINDNVEMNEILVNRSFVHSISEDLTSDLINERKRS